MTLVYQSVLSVYTSGTRPLFKFMSRTHGLNEELGRHREWNGKIECSVCGAECVGVVFVMWECPAHKGSSQIRDFLAKISNEWALLRGLLIFLVVNFGRKTESSMKE